jgi:hypothetical protein
VLWTQSGESTCGDLNSVAVFEPRKSCLTVSPGVSDEHQGLYHCFWHWHLFPLLGFRTWSVCPVAELNWEFCYLRKAHLGKGFECICIVLAIRKGQGQLAVMEKESMKGWRSPQDVNRYNPPSSAGQRGTGGWQDIEKEPWVRHLCHFDKPCTTLSVRTQDFWLPSLSSPFTTVP